MEQSDFVRSLSFFELTAIGVGSVIGCGIFFLFSNILKRSGPLTALAFLFAAVPNIVAALSYAELSGIYNSNTTEYESLKDAFNETTASVAIYLLLLFLIFNTTTIIIFASNILNLEQFKFAFCILVLLLFSVINYFGINVTKSITSVMSFIVIGLLVAIILFGATRWHLDEKHFKLNINFEDDKFQTFWVASFLAIFLYTGYDSVIKLSEETIDSKNTVPKAVITTVIVTSLLYIFIAFTAVCMRNRGSLSRSVMPIIGMCENIFGKGSYTKVIYLLGLFIVLNTFFICLVSLSRFVYGLGKENKLPMFVSEVNNAYNTPHNAILCVFIAIGFALLVNNGEKTASIANIFFLAFMIMLCLSVVILRFKYDDKERSYKIPLNFYNVPVPVIIGLLIAVLYMTIGICYFSRIG